MSIKARLSRRDFVKMMAVGAGAVALTGCSQATPVVIPTAVPTEAPVPTATVEDTPIPPTPTSAPTEIPFTAGVTPGSPTHARGWTTNVPPSPQGLPYNIPVQITSSRNSINLEFEKGDDYENSPFTRLCKERMGVEWKVKFTYATADERTQKYNLGMASSDLPDFLEAVPLTNFLDLLDAGLVEDITDVYESTASELVKKNLSWNNNLPWIYAEVNGRKMGFPFLERASQNDKLLWVRQDWLDKLGLTAPKTLDDLYKVAKAFKENDMGQGAKGTTVGLLACIELRTWYASLDPIFGTYGVIHDYWLKAADGSLVYGAVMPEMKEPLALLAQWYKEGIIPADFDTKQAWEQNPLVAANQCGLLFAPYFGGSYGAGDSVKNDPTAKWAFYDPPAGPSGKIGKAWTNPVGQFVHCFRKGFKNVDAVVQLTNWMAEWYEVPNKSRMHGWDGYDYEWTADDKITRKGQQDRWRYWPFGVVGNSASTGTSVFRGSEDDAIAVTWGDLPKDQQDAAQEITVDDPTGLNQLVRKSYIRATQVAEEQGIKNEFYGLPTATMKERQADMDTLVNTTLLGMIKGTVPLGDFDKFVEQWKSMGGDAVTQEVNDWYASQPK